MERLAEDSARPAAPRLSICISTLNRARFLRETLQSIVPQITQECEVVVVDNASTDDTADVFADPQFAEPRVRYIKASTNNGLDRNFDRAAELARGEYCWLMPDDDLIKPGAVAAVLKALTNEPSAVFVNYEFRDFSMSKVLQTRVLDFESDRIYGPWEAERMFVEFGDYIRYIGALIVKRSVWLSRDRNLYSGSDYGFVGMIYQARFPSFVHVLAEPHVAYRFGNVKTFDPYVMEIALGKWPSLIASLPFSDALKRKFHSGEPWRHWYEMLFWRGSGYYDYAQYRKWIRPRLRTFTEKLLPVISAIFPRTAANLILTTYLSLHGSRLRQLRGFHLETLRTSPYNLHQRLSRTHTPRSPLPAQRNPEPQS